MADLLSVADAKTFLGITVATYDTLLSQLLDELEAQFEMDCGRKRIPFAAAATRTEVRDGIGSPELYLNYPVATLTSIKIGLDVTDPDETLDVDDVDVVVFGVGERRLVRTDGGVFGALGVPRCVQVVYGAGDDLPSGARLALKRGLALVFRQRGSEDAVRESLADYSHDLQTIRGEEFWQLAVSSEQRGTYR